MSNRNRLKKLEETFHFEIFKRLFSEFPLMDYLSNEHPDFLVKRHEDMLGIEHTKLLKNELSNSENSSPSMDGDRRKILKKARIICEKKDISPLWVKVLFKNTNLNFKRKDIVRISESLATCIQTYLKGVMKQNRMIIRSDDFSTELPEIRRIDITSGITGGTNWLQMHRWEVVCSSYVRKDFTNDLQTCIDKKNGRHSDYCKKCDECWLLIVANRSIPSQCFDISEQTVNHIYKSEFKRIFYLEIMHERLVELSVIKTTNALKLTKVGARRPAPFSTLYRQGKY